jgi:hypothetical protein
MVAFMVIDHNLYKF